MSNLEETATIFFSTQGQTGRPGMIGQPGVVGEKVKKNNLSVALFRS